ncbi:MAG: signal peptidase I [Corynebacterium sp.]|nr:signal peptidase I [Corynebacterium sp.]
MEASNNEWNAQEPENQQGKKPAKKEKKERPWYLEVLSVVVLALVLVFVVQNFIGRVYVIPSASMEPTLHGCTGCEGDRIFVNKMSYRFGSPKDGDVVVFKDPDSWESDYQSIRSTNPVVRGLQNVGSFIGIVAPDEKDLVKRVMATGGETIRCLPGDAGITVNGEVRSADYTLNPTQYPIDPLTGSEACGGAYFGPITVPEGHVFVMGDNRTNSADSRYHLDDENQGTVPVENIVGKVNAVVWPLNRWHSVGNPYS